MFKHSASLFVLSLFWLPSSPANPAALRTGLRRVAGVSLIAGASYLGLTQDGRKTRTTVWDAAGKVVEKISETAESNQEWFTKKLSEQKDYLAEIFGEQKDEHTVMLKTLDELRKQNKVLKRQSTDVLKTLNEQAKELKILKQQNALILNKVYDDEALTQQPNFLTDDNEANEHSLTRHHKDDKEKPDNDLLTRRGVIVMETDQE